MGIHTGEPVVREDDYVGLDVHRVARISAAAHGGQVLVSDATHRLLGDEPLPDVHLRDLGEHLLKDLPAPERLFTLQAPELQADFPPLRALDATALPVKASPLVGRAREVATLSELVARDDVRLVTCTGAGGIGKTRLSLQVAAEMASGFRNGVVLVALAPVSDAVSALPTIAASLGVRPAGQQLLEDDLVAHLAGRSLLLVLDNFEQVTPAAPDVARILERAPEVKVLATSRAPLRVSGEHEFRVPPLPNEDAVTLFAERATAVRPGFVLTPSGESAAAEICYRLDGLPWRSSWLRRERSCWGRKSSSPASPGPSTCSARGRATSRRGNGRLGPRSTGATSCSIRTSSASSARWPSSSEGRRSRRSKRSARARTCWS
jgi:hypothetical protein